MSKAAHSRPGEMPLTGHDHDRRDDSRRPVWASILFMLVASLALWAVVVLGVLRWIEPDCKG